MGPEWCAWGAHARHVRERMCRVEVLLVEACAAAMPHLFKPQTLGRSETKTSASTVDESTSARTCAEGLLNVERPNDATGRPSTSLSSVSVVHIERALCTLRTDLASRFNDLLLNPLCVVQSISKKTASHRACVSKDTLWFQFIIIE